MHESRVFSNWLNHFQTENGRPLRVLHVGNIANNAYNNAKIQRQRGIEADVICHDYYHIMGCPEWEDADFEGDIGDPFRPDWSVCNLKGFERPDWFAQGPFIQCADYLIHKNKKNIDVVESLWSILSAQSALAKIEVGNGAYVSKLKYRVKGLLKRLLPPLLINLFRRSLLKYRKLFDSNLPIAEPLIKQYRKLFPDRTDVLSIEDILPWKSNLQKWKELFDNYDIIQAYATFPILPLLCENRNFVAYEHGTIREIPFEENAQGRVCAISYKLAPVVFVTNSDNLIAADRLGLNEGQVYCLPHAFDNEKLFRFSDENAHRFSPPSDRVVFFSPARQHWKDHDPSMAKGNDYVFHAVRELKDAGFNFKLELVAWGRDIQDSKQLIRELEIEEYIHWVQPMKKRQLWQKYMSVHAVIDQLLLPALGGVGFEAMTLGRRLLSAMDMDLGKRFFGASPVMLDVHDTASVKAAMRSVLEDPDDHGGVGKDAREWIRRYHSADRVCQIQVDAYRKILKN